VAHKTGDIGTALGDSGAVYLPDGRKYFVSMQVERPYNDYTARDMVQRASRLIYDYVSAQPALVQAQVEPESLSQMHLPDSTEPSVPVESSTQAQ
jgi:beta-lactamase class A